MCGRYFITIEEKELRQIIAAVDKSSAEHAEAAIFKGGEIFPGSLAPIITAENKVQFFVWGFPSLLGKKPHINARSETAATAKTFKDAMFLRRCLVPASGYYEWQTLDKRHKQKYAFRLSGQTVMFMAGIYSSNGRFAILTRQAAPAVAAIHERMPVIIPRDLSTKWLKESPAPMYEALTDLSFAPVPVTTV
ncbi:MAG: SOS response-associated peptidase [Firmicutes bacterium]|nr:SOS response-associated peptidase [Bacillota bacterium]